MSPVAKVEHYQPLFGNYRRQYDESLRIYPDSTGKSEEDRARHGYFQVPTAGRYARLGAQGEPCPYPSHDPELARCLRCYGKCVRIICLHAVDHHRSAAPRKCPDCLRRYRQATECSRSSSLNVISTIPNLAAFQKVRSHRNAYLPCKQT